MLFRSVSGSSGSCTGNSATATLSTDSTNAIGYNQTWQIFSVGSTRVLGTAYQNTTGKPISVIYSYAANSNPSVVNAEVSTDNSTWITVCTSRSANDDDLNGGNVTMIVPNNLYYRIRYSTGSGSTYQWAELR